MKMTVTSADMSLGVSDFPTAPSVPDSGSVAHTVIAMLLEHVRRQASITLGRHVSFKDVKVVLGEPFDPWWEFRKED